MASSKFANGSSNRRCAFGQGDAQPAPTTSMREQAHRQGRPQLSQNMPQGPDFIVGADLLRDSFVGADLLRDNFRGLNPLPQARCANKHTALGATGTLTKHAARPWFYCGSGFTPRQLCGSGFTPRQLSRAKPAPSGSMREQAHCPGGDRNSHQTCRKALIYCGSGFTPRQLCGSGFTPRQLSRDEPAPASIRKQAHRPRASGALTLRDHLRPV